MCMNHLLKIFVMRNLLWNDRKIILFYEEINLLTFFYNFYKDFLKQKICNI